MSPSYQFLCGLILLAPLANGFALPAAPPGGRVVRQTSPQCSALTAAVVRYLTDNVPVSREFTIRYVTFHLGYDLTDPTQAALLICPLIECSTVDEAVDVLVHTNAAKHLAAAQYQEAVTELVGLMHLDLRNPSAVMTAVRAFLNAVADLGLLNLDPSGRRQFEELDPTGDYGYGYVTQHPIPEGELWTSLNARRSVLWGNVSRLLDTADLMAGRSWTARKEVVLQATDGRLNLNNRERMHDLVNQIAAVHDFDDLFAMFENNYLRPLARNVLYQTFQEYLIGNEVFYRSQLEENPDESTRIVAQNYLTAYNLIEASGLMSLT